ncbi:MAG: (Fe-S)-binding protein [Desulfotignum sp.]|nr:(Fe-S)-binding protein [Desulfotignum sp.]
MTGSDPTRPDLPDKSPLVELGTERTSLLKEMVMERLPEGGNLEFCFACGACASGCPASGLEGMDPRKLVRMLSLGMDEQVMASNWVWICTTCDRCLHVCPMQIDIPKIIDMVRSSWPGEKKPRGISDYCSSGLENDTCSIMGMSSEDWQFVVANVADDVRATQKGFDALNVPMDKKGAMFFLNQISRLPVREPEEMAPLWKILHLAGADWTYGTRGWAAENYCMFLSDNKSWETLVRKKASVVDGLGCRILLNTESGHDFTAFRQGLDRFKIPHSFEVKSIIAYYAYWIRTGRLKVDPEWNRDLKIRFTVQDPCQLVRKSYGDFIAEELRFVVEAAVGEENFVDMYPNRSNNYCCGGGGGAIQTDFLQERRHYGRLKLDQILETEAAYCITPCNNCHEQIKDIGRYYNARFNTVHLWTVLCLAMGILGKNERRHLGEDLRMAGLK